MVFLAVQRLCLGAILIANLLPGIESFSWFDDEFTKNTLIEQLCSKLKAGATSEVCKQRFLQLYNLKVDSIQIWPLTDVFEYVTDTKIYFGDVPLYEAICQIMELAKQNGFEDYVNKYSQTVSFRVSRSLETFRKVLELGIDPTWWEKLFTLTKAVNNGSFTLGFILLDLMQDKDTRTLGQVFPKFLIFTEKHQGLTFIEQSILAIMEFEAYRFNAGNPITDDDLDYLFQSIAHNTPKKCEAKWDYGFVTEMLKTEELRKAPMNIVRSFMTCGYQLILPMSIKWANNEMDFKYNKLAEELVQNKDDASMQSTVKGLINCINMEMRILTVQLIVEHVSTSGTMDKRLAVYQFLEGVKESIPNYKVPQNSPHVINMFSGLFKLFEARKVDYSQINTFITTGKNQETMEKDVADTLTYYEIK